MLPDDDEVLRVQLHPAQRRKNTSTTLASMTAGKASNSPREFGSLATEWTRLRAKWIFKIQVSRMPTSAIAACGTASTSRSMTSTKNSAPRLRPLPLLYRPFAVLPPPPTPSSAQTPQTRKKLIQMWTQQSGASMMIHRTMKAANPPAITSLPNSRTCKIWWLAMMFLKYWL